MVKLMMDGPPKLFNWQGKGKKRVFSKLNLKAVLLGNRGEYLWQKRLYMMSAVWQKTVRLSVLMAFNNYVLINCRQCAGPYCMQRCHRGGNQASRHELAWDSWRQEWGQAWERKEEEGRKRTKRQLKQPVLLMRTGWLMRTVILWNRRSRVHYSVMLLSADDLLKITTSAVNLDWLYPKAFSFKSYCVCQFWSGQMVLNIFDSGGSNMHLSNCS